MAYKVRKSAQSFDSMSIKALKEEAAKRKVDLSSCLEKNEIIKALLRAEPGCADTECAFSKRTSRATKVKPQEENLERLSITQLKCLANERDIDVSKCLEKHDIIRCLSPKKENPASHERHNGSTSTEKQRTRTGVQFVPGTAWANCRTKRKGPPPPGGKPKSPVFTGATG